METMAGCLDGIRVIELARYQAGPRGGMILSDLGAEVIKIEKPGGEETRKSPPMVKGQSIYFSVYNRGKKSVCLDLRQEAGKAVLRDLVKTADFVLENFRPGTIDQMGFGYEELKKIKPDIILISVSAFGQYGPYRELPGFDPIGQAMGGLMYLTGQPVGQPLGTASSIVDRYTALHATIGALAALRHRDRTGEGQVVDVCLLDSALTMTEIPTSYYLATGQEGGESGRPPYKAKDGWIVLSGSSKEMTRRLMEVIGLEADPNQPGMLPSFRSSDARSGALVDWCAEHTVDEIVETLRGIGVPVAPVNTIPQVAAEPHVWEREMLVKQPDALAGELALPGLTIKFSKTPGKLGPVPTPGQHTDEVLGGLLGYAAERMAELRGQGVI
jgi:crotonobetainyl-CoA:carnitine CoA-transferase CaiB-like acyl-CoA transferase